MNNFHEYSVFFIHFLFFNQQKIGNQQVVESFNVLFLDIMLKVHYNKGNKTKKEIHYGWR